MSTTKSQNGRNVQRESSNTVSEGLISPVFSKDEIYIAQDVQAAGPSFPKSPGIENRVIESIRTFLKKKRNHIRGQNSIS